MIIALGPERIELLPEGALWIAKYRLLCISDMHLEKDTSYRARATFLPPYGSFETLKKLDDLLNRFKPHIVIAAGDSFHDKFAAQRLTITLRNLVNQMVSKVSSWYWISGNHDTAVDAIIMGRRCADFNFNKMMFRHQSIDKSQVEISGHYHPKLRINILGHTMVARCFVQHRDTLILPSFGQFTGGLDIDSADFCAVVPRKERRIFAIYQNEIFAL